MDSKNEIIYGDRSSPVFIKDTRTVIVPREPATYSVYSEQEAIRLGFEIERMKVYQTASIGLEETDSNYEIRDY